VAIQLDIVTPERQVFSGSANEVRVPGWEGEFGVLPEHASFLSLAKAGVLAIIDASGESRFVIGRGFAEAGPDRVVVLTEVCESADQVDKSAAGAAKAEAEKKLETLDPLSDAYAQCQARIELAAARLSI
jgi:F-type H+-transporting ATPase subunit epsilon